MFEFSNSGWHIQLLSPVSGEFGNILAYFAMATKQLFRPGGNFFENFSNLRSPHSRILPLVSLERPSRSSRMSHHVSSVRSLAYLLIKVHFWA